MSIRHLTRPRYDGRFYFFDIRDYGALCDGSTDDTTAIANAIAAAQASTTPGINFQTSGGTFQGGTQANGAGIVFIPRGVTIASNIVLGHRVGLVGEGWGSIIRQKASSTGPLIQNQFDGTRHAKYCFVQNLSVNGNKANQTAANHGIYWVGDQTFNFNSPLDEDWDQNCSVHNVYVWNCKGDGINCTGSGENRISNSKSHHNDGNGVFLDYDNYMTHVTVGWSGLRGIYVSGDNNHVTSSKAWYSGQVTAGSGQGCYVAGDSGVIAGCSFQDNNAEGMKLDSAFAFDIKGVMLDSNSKSSAGTYAQLAVVGGSVNNSVSASVRNRYNAGTPGTVALEVSGSSVANDILVAAGPSPWGVSTLVKSGSTISANKVSFNGEHGGWQEVAYGATITPNILQGESIRVGTLTANVTIGTPTWFYEGARLNLRYKQDATGGRTVTYPAAFDTSGVTTNTAANAVTIHKWRYSATASKWEIWA